MCEKQRPIGQDKKLLFAIACLNKQKNQPSGSSSQEKSYLDLRQ
jgi:hypothetical protein